MLTESQKLERIGKVTSSVIYDVIYSPYAAYQKIMGLDPFEGNQQTRIGDALEAPVMQLAADELGLSAEKAPFRRHPHFSWAADSCDALFRNDAGDLVAIGEIKTHGMAVARGYDDDSDTMPDRVAIQSHWHLIHWPEVDVCYVCPLLGGWKLEVKTFEIQRDQELHDYLLAAGLRFYEQFISKETSPPPDWSDQAAESISAMFPKDNGESIEASSEILDMVKELKALKSEASSRERRVKELQNQIRLFFGHNAHLLDSGTRIASLTSVKRKGYTVKESEYRQLRLAK